MAKRPFSQIFLKDKNIAKKIVSSIDPKVDDLVVEIGAGRGILTSILADLVKKVFAIEIDRNLCDFLRSLNISNLCVINEDFMKIKIEELKDGSKKVKVVGNLPYHISSQILIKLFSEISHIEVMVLMFQREVGRRIVAKPSNKEYGIISILSQIYTYPRIVANVSKNMFWPTPSVDSSVLKFLPKENIEILDEKKFLHFLKLLFSHRRKTIKNSLLKSLRDFEKVREILDFLDIDEKRRPETLTVEEIIKIWKIWSNYWSDYIR